MAIRIALGNYEPVEGDPLGRDYIGYFPRMTEQEAWIAGRGVWKISPESVGREVCALIVGGGLVRAIAKIEGMTQHEDRYAIEGELVGPGHPVYDAYFGKPDPLSNSSRNRIAYGPLDEEQSLREHPCSCGCGELTDREFRPGHEFKAMSARVQAHFGGSYLQLIQWIDAEKGAPDAGPETSSGSDEGTAA